MVAEKMNIDERVKYLRLMQERYVNAGRQGKAGLLDELEAMTGVPRKDLLARRSSPDLRRQRRHRARSRLYGPDGEQVVRVVAEALAWIGAERLQPGLATTAQHWARFGHRTLNDALLGQWQEISISTLRRILYRIGRPADTRPHERRGRRPESTVQAWVPVGVIPWDEPEAGHFEADLVLPNCAGQEGPFVCPLQLVDVLTGWSERFAVLGYEFDEIWPALQAFRGRCPIPVREIHTDNGSEFVNLPFISHFGEQVVHARLPRGRPGDKNDNRCVEQKNGSLLRAYLDHLDRHTAAHRFWLAQWYEDMWGYDNLFQPVRRQTARRAASTASGLVRIVRPQDSAATPLQRLRRAKPPLARETAERLQTLHHHTAPLALKRRIHRQLGELAQMVHHEHRRETISCR
ncbi:MAG: transposase family protein [Chloroflexi bacterium]|nr:transposase family protein [Chloroflexota bacterium]